MPTTYTIPQSFLQFLYIIIINIIPLNCMDESFHANDGLRMPPKTIYI